MNAAQTKAEIEKWFRRYMTIEQAAEFYGVSIRTMYRRANEINGVMILRIKKGKRMRQIRLIPKPRVEVVQQLDGQISFEDM